MQGWLCLSRKAPCERLAGTYACFCMVHTQKNEGMTYSCRSFFAQRVRLLNFPGHLIGSQHLQLEHQHTILFFNLRVILRNNMFCVCKSWRKRTLDIQCHDNALNLIPEPILFALLCVT